MGEIEGAQLRVAIVGGGLVGALEACFLAKRGFKVTLFESRHDGRHEPSYYGRSINLAISLRGISALKRLGLDHIVDELAIPMGARMIHKPNGKTASMPYDPDGRCINSIERAALNNFLLDKAEQQFKVEIKFNHKLVDMAADSGQLYFRPSNYKQLESQQENDLKILEYQFDLVLGCDGSRSSVRSLLARQTKMEVQQSYIEHGYLELRIDPTETGDFRMPANYLHIWPRGQYMMIALPNKDRSFTCTLFMPYSILGKIKDPLRGLEFFETNFPDSVDLIGRNRISETLSQVAASPLISIRCSPYQNKGRIALLGDAAHAMVPFYGQGMNCGFEDCLVLDELLDKHLMGDIHDVETVRQAIGRALSEYDELRQPNGHSMCELAMYNYVEMRDLVNTWSFKARKSLDTILYRLFKDRWMPLYTMVTFSRTPIDECIRKRLRQDELIGRAFKVASLGLGLALVVGASVRARGRL